MAVHSFSFKSSWLAGAEYDTDTGIATVHTKRGDSYQHSLSPESFKDFVTAGSPGQWYNANFGMRAVR
jgi:KTSC domain